MKDNEDGHHTTGGSGKKGGVGPKIDRPKVGDGKDDCVGWLWRCCCGRLYLLKMPLLTYICSTCSPYSVT